MNAISDSQVDYDDLDAALRRCGSNWNSGQAHGLLCGLLSVAGAAGAKRWHALILEDTSADNAFCRECESMLDAVVARTWQQLAERQSEFELLLPEDDNPAELRAAAMAHWCEGFLHGLVSEKNESQVRSRLASEPIADVVRDMLQITRATVGTDDGEDIEDAWAELVEYLRVAAQLTYEELADVRRPAGDGSPGAAETLH